MNDEDIALIRRFRPADPPHDPAAKARAWTRLRREFDSAPTWRRTLRVRAGRLVAITGVLGTSAAMIVVVTKLGLLPADIPRSTPNATLPTATPQPGTDTTLRTLELAAATVARQPAPARPSPDQWVYTQRITAFALQPDGGTMLRGKVKVEEWWKFDGKQMAQSVQNGQLYRKRILALGEKPRRLDPRFNGGAIGGPGVVNQTPNKLYDYAAGLPTDPDALLARIRKDYRDNGRDVTTFGVIAMFFRQNPLIPAKTNAALYRALAKIPGVRVVSDATDFAGRRGIGVVFDRGSRPGSPQTIVLDPQTYRYLGDDIEAILGFAVVDEVGQRR